MKNVSTTLDCGGSETPPWDIAERGGGKFNYWFNYAKAVWRFASHRSPKVGRTPRTSYPLRGSGADILSASAGFQPVFLDSWAGCPPGRLEACPTIESCAR